MSKTAPKIAVLLWDSGGRLATALDLQALVQKLARAKGVGRAESIGDPGLPAFREALQGDLEAGVIDRILWVGRFSDEQRKGLPAELSAFGLNPYLHHWCDLEEQGLLLAGLEPGLRNRKAGVLLDMALARTRLLEPLEPLELPATDAVLILGAGVAGLHAGASLAELGKRVYLVEKESGAGGKVALLSRFFPRLCDPHCGLQFCLDKLSVSSLAEFHTLSTLVALEGSPGNFQARILKKPRYVREEKCNGCGVCLAACPVDLPASQVHPDEKFAPFLKSARKAIHPAYPMPFPAAFVVERQHCPPECRKCALVCPSGAVDLDQAPTETVLDVGAVLVTTGWDPYPISQVAEFGYQRHARIISNLEMEQLLGADRLGSPGALPGSSWEEMTEIGFIQCVGSRDERHLPYCSSVCCAATLKQAVQIKERNPLANCYVFYIDMRSPGFDEDLYRRARNLGVVFNREIPSAVDPDPATGKLGLRVIDPSLNKPLQINLDLLVLAGGMAPSHGTPDVAQALNLPQNSYGFFESHYQCHPEESQRTGIYAAGCAREPMQVSHAIESAHLAAMKALKFLEGRVLIEPTYPVVDKTRCDQCKRCMEECPFGSFTFDEKNFPTPDLARCRQCGNCMGLCPLGVISLQHNTIKQMAAQVEAFDVSFMGDNEPVVLAFLCQNDAYHLARGAVAAGLDIPANVIFLKVPCAGAVNNALVADALSFGIDGVLIAGCPEDQCHYVQGSQLVQKRSGDLRDKLQKMMVEPERVRFAHLEIRDSVKFVSLLHSYIGDLKAMGPNPFKI
ncbi:MAG: hydrogenase iron-sulfur subunit [Desulfobaccales bacterium]